MSQSSIQTASPQDFRPRTAAIPVVLANGQTISPAVDLGGLTLAGIMFPATMTGATMTFKASLDGTNYFAVVDSAGVAVSITVSAAKYVALDPKLFGGIRFLELVSASAEGADRAITLAGRA